MRRKARGRHQVGTFAVEDMDGDQFLWALAEAVDGLLEQGCVAAIKGHKAEIREDGAAAWGEKTEVEADAQEPRLRLHPISSLGMAGLGRCNSEIRGPRSRKSISSNHGHGRPHRREPAG